jgi:hypothetical protein
MPRSVGLLVTAACFARALGDLTCGDASLGPVLNGVDIVATFEAAKAGASIVPPAGSEEYSYTTDEGFVFWFESAANAATYADAPEAYPLGAGGYCGLAVSGNDPACNNELCKGGACVE